MLTGSPRRTHSAHGRTVTIEIALADVTAAKRIPDRRARSATETARTGRGRRLAAGRDEPSGRLAAARRRGLDRAGQLRAGGRRTGPPAGRGGRRGRPRGTANAACARRSPCRCRCGRRSHRRTGPAAAGTDHADAGADRAAHRVCPTPGRPLGRQLLDTPDRRSGSPGSAGARAACHRRRGTILTGVPAARYAAGYSPDGALVATARGTVVDGWLGITAGRGRCRTGRRRGLGPAAHARPRAAGRAGAGAERAYLQVEETNDSRAYGCTNGSGFSTHHTYRTYHA